MVNLIPQCFPFLSSPPSTNPPFLLYFSTYCFHEILLFFLYSSLAYIYETKHLTIDFLSLTFSLYIKLSSSVHFSVKNTAFKIAILISIVCIYHISFLCSTLEKHRLIPLLAIIVNHTAIKMVVQVLLYYADFRSFG